MKIRALALLFLALSLGQVQASPEFWDGQHKDKPKSPPKPPEVSGPAESTDPSKPTPTPVVLPKFSVSPTPEASPDPNASPKNPNTAALLAVVVPGSGHFYTGEPLKGVLFAGVFGLSLWQSIENFKLRRESPNSDQFVAKDETAGSLYGLAALAAYGFNMQDAYSSAKRYNRRHNLKVTFGLGSHLTAGLAYNF